jgi:cell division protein FtsI/penicillin-binding protein 2
VSPSVGERIRVRLLFGMLGIVPVFLAGWLGWLQVVQGGELRRGDARKPVPLDARAAERQRLAREPLPSPRGTILDRHGRTLAIDCEVYEVRMDVRPPASRRADPAVFRSYLAEIADAMAGALANDPGLADRREARQRHRELLLERLGRAFKTDLLPASGPLTKAVPATADVLVDTEVDVLAVVEALRRQDEDRSSIALHWQRTHKRVYPEREHTYGVVGFVESVPIAAPGREQPAAYEPRGVFGMEALAALEPGDPGERWFARDSRRRPYFTAVATMPQPPTVLHSTLDLELQRLAGRELERQAATKATEGRVTIPQWGALVLVEVSTGELLAAASWHRDVKHRKGAAFTPYQNLYEPGSIVKPLVFAVALQKAGLDWHRDYDCSSSGEHHRRTVEETGRTVHDDHACGTLDPHGILVNSSNIGAVRVGSLLSRQHWREYLDFYGFGKSLHLGLPHENAGRIAADLSPTRSEAKFKRWSGSSLSIGYELQVNALQMARAYVSLLAGRPRQLRLYRAVEIGGQRHSVPDAGRSADGGANPGANPGDLVLSAASVEAVMAAMTDVISPEPGATGRHVHERIRKELGVDLHGLVAGKTGTAVSYSVVPGKGRVEVRNASFVGYVPADAPRFLAVCVLQKDDDARFYGGSYAAPPVVRLLLQVLELEERRRLRQEPPVSGSPGESGWSAETPEASQAGR